MGISPLKIVWFQIAMIIDRLLHKLCVFNNLPSKGSQHFTSMASEQVTVCSNYYGESDVNTNVRASPD